MNYQCRLICLVALFSLVLLTSCHKEGSERQYNVSAFTKINTGENVHVDIRQHPQQQITATGATLELLQVYVQNGELFVLAPNHEGANIQVAVSVPHIENIIYRQNSTISILEGLNLEGRLQIDGREQAQLHIAGVCAIQHLSIDLRENAALSIENLIADELSLVEKNSNICHISGMASRVQVNLFNDARFNLGAGSFKKPFSGPLVATECFAELRGQSQAWVHATTQLWVEAYGTCGLYYQGSPEVLISNLYEGAFLERKD